MGDIEPVRLHVEPRPCASCGELCDLTQVTAMARFDDTRLYEVRGWVGSKKPERGQPAPGTAPPIRWRHREGLLIAPGTGAQEATELARAIAETSASWAHYTQWVVDVARQPGGPPAGTERRQAQLQADDAKLRQRLQQRWPNRGQRHPLEAARSASVDAAPIPPPPRPPAPPTDAALQPLLRTAWLPEFGQTTNPVGWTGGLPRLDAGTDWPPGPYGGEPMGFAAAIQHPVHGWLQVFYDPLANSAPDAVTVLPLGSEERSAPPGVRVHPRRDVVRWVEAHDLPSWPDRELSAFSPDDRPGHHLGGTKLGGWPTWIQDDRTPELPADARFLLQLYADPHGHMWGTDLGVLTVFRSAEGTVIHSFADGS